jgi:hypothetical protein
MTKVSRSLFGRSVRAGLIWTCSYMPTRLCDRSSDSERSMGTQSYGVSFRVGMTSLLALSHRNHAPCPPSLSLHRSRIHASRPSPILRLHTKSTHRSNILLYSIMCVDSWGYRVSHRIYNLTTPRSLVWPYGLGNMIIRRLESTRYRFNIFNCSHSEYFLPLPPTVDLSSHRRFAALAASYPPTRL